MMETNCRLPGVTVGHGDFLLPPLSLGGGAGPVDRGRRVSEG